MEEEQKEPVQKKSGKKVLLGILIAVIVLLALALIVFATPLKEMVLAKKTAPEVTLELLQGTVLDEDSGKYLFEVEALVTGHPMPKVTFNRYDNPEEVGENKIILLLESGESFTLVAVAESTEGKATATLELVAEEDPDDMGGETPDPDPDPPATAQNRPPVISSINFPSGLFQTGGTYTVTAQASDPDGDTLSYQWSVTAGTVPNLNANPIAWTTPGSPGDPQLTVIVRDGKGGEAVLSKQVAVGYLRLSPIPSQSGQIIKDQEVKSPTCIYAGDSNTNRIVRGYIAFKVNDLEDIPIKTAELRLAEPKTWGNPGDFMHGSLGTTGLRINIARWGDRESDSLVLADYNLSGDTLAGYTNYDITHTSQAGESVKNIVKLLQGSLDSGYSRIMFRLMFSNETSDNDNQWDGVEYQLNTISLYVTF